MRIHAVREAPFGSVMRPLVAPRAADRSPAPHSSSAFDLTGVRGIATGSSGTAPPSVDDAVRSPGRPLDGAARARFEPLVGRDLGHVRLHSDERAQASAVDVGARAYTVGQHIVLGPGERPTDRLLGHEIGHTLQQGAGVQRAAADLPLGSATDPSERQADAVGEALAAGRRAPVVTPKAPSLQRQEIGPNQTVTSPLVHQRLLGLGDAGVNEILRKLPARNMWDNRFHEVKRTTVGNATHVFEVMLTQEANGNPLGGGEDGATLELVPKREGTASAPIYRHRIVIKVFTPMRRIIETHYHELIHARIIIDQDLPPSEKSSHGKALDQMRETTEMTRDAQGRETPGALAIASGMAPRRAAVTTAMDELRSLFNTVDPSVASKWTARESNAALFDFLLNEKHTGDASAQKLRRSETNRHLAHLYAGSVEGAYAARVRSLGFAQQLKSMSESKAGASFLEARTKALEDALVLLYDAFDQQRTDIERFKMQPPPAQPPVPLERMTPNELLGTGSMGAPSPPLGIGGQPIKIRP